MGHVSGLLKVPLKTETLSCIPPMITWESRQT